MTGKRHLVPLCLALTLVAAPGFAQTAQTPPAEPAAAPASGAGPKAPATPAPANAQQRPGTGANAQPRSDSGGGSPYDYRASEEISEDLPVSFPADI